VQHAGLSDLTKIEGSRNLAILQREAIRAGVRGAIYQETMTIGDIAKSTLQNAALGMVHNKIGDIGIDHELKDGGFEKVMMHSVAGGLFADATGGDFKYGAVAGGLGELTSSFNPQDSGKARPPIDQLAASVGTFLAGGKAKDMDQASRIAGSSHEYNNMLHPAAIAIEEGLLLLAGGVLVAAGSYNEQLKSEEGVIISNSTNANSVINSVIEVGNAMHNIELEYSKLVLGSSNQEKPQLESFPIIDQKPKIFSTPIYMPISPEFVTPQPAKKDIFILPGFAPAPALPKPGGFSIYNGLDLSILYNDKSGTSGDGETTVNKTSNIENKVEGVRKTNISKAESKIWKELKPYRGDIKTNGLTGKDQRFYKWDFDHNEIEVYGPRGKNHLGAADPTTGEIYRAPVKARTIRGLIK
jgi:hypothetical protein